MMRDIKRIEPFLERLKEIWLKNPDMRFAQLIGNVHPCTSNDYIDPYYIEDESYIKTIEEFYSVPRVFRIFGKLRRNKQ